MAIKKVPSIYIHSFICFFFCQNYHSLIRFIEFISFFKLATFFLMCVKRSKEASPPIRAEHFQTCMLIYRQFLRKKIYFFWHSETMENYIQNFRLFSLPKICFSKTGNVKSLPKIYLTFLTKKSMYETGPLHQIREEHFSSNFSLLSLPKNEISYRMSYAENENFTFSLNSCRKKK